jgi:hypothetical protein
MNGHMARVGDQPTAGSFGHGVQVIDEDKEFKYVNRAPTLRPSLTDPNLNPQHQPQ